MDEFSISSTADLFFSFRLSNSGACVVWRFKDFSTLKEGPKCYDSPEFIFKGTKWCLSLQPFSKDEKCFKYVGLFLNNNSSFPLELKYKFILKNESGEDYCSNVIRHDFSKVAKWGFSRLFSRKYLFDRKFGSFLPEDVLTICCKMEVAENLETETAICAGSRERLPTNGINFERAMRNFREPFDSGRFSDVVLYVGEETIPAHKVILSAQSDVFKAMFENNMKESQENTVDLTGMDSTVAKAMLLYMYTREVKELSVENTLQLYVAADKYMLVELREKCREYLTRNMSAENVGEVFEIASLHCDTLLTKAAKNFFAANVNSILKSKDWKEFSAKKSSVAVELLSYSVTSNYFF